MASLLSFTGSIIMIVLILQEGTYKTAKGLVDRYLLLGAVCDSFSSLINGQNYVTLMNVMPRNFGRRDHIQACMSFTNAFYVGACGWATVLCISLMQMLLTTKKVTKSYDKMKHGIIWTLVLMIFILTATTDDPKLAQVVTGSFVGIVLASVVAVYVRIIKLVVDTMRFKHENSMSTNGQGGGRASHSKELLRKVKPFVLYPSVLLLTFLPAISVEYLPYRPLGLELFAWSLYFASGFWNCLIYLYRRCSSARKKRKVKPATKGKKGRKRKSGKASVDSSSSSASSVDSSSRSLMQSSVM